MAAPQTLGDVTPASVTIIGETGVFNGDEGVPVDHRDVVATVTLLADASLSATAPASAATNDTLQFAVKVDNFGPSIAHTASVTWTTCMSV